MLKKILLGLAVVVAGFLIVVALQPGSFRVERSTMIAATPAALFSQVNDLRKAAVWSPWLKLDPAVKVAYEGPATGVGASSSWAGNHNIGEGRQTITESRAHELVRLRLDFVKPFAGTSTAEFTLKPSGSQTIITWSLAGEKNFISKAVCLFMDQDKMIGEPFEQGLASLKALVESPRT